MSLMSKSKSGFEMVWVRRISKNGSTECWHFHSGLRDLTLVLAASVMNGVCPDGQLMTLELDIQKGLYAVSNPLIIYGVDDKALLERHFAWVPVGKEYILRDIWGFLVHIEDPALRAFYQSVLFDDSIMQFFLQGRASHHHHHEHVGGLLEHSYEVASTAASLCWQHKVGSLSACVAFIGGLLHDIGKIHLYYNQLNGGGVCGQHESFNFLVLARPLDKLRVSSPKVFEALCSCLTIKLGHQVDSYLPANMVHLCDRLSVDVCNWRRAFAGAPPYYWYAKSSQGEQLYKRLG